MIIIKVEINRDKSINISQNEFVEGFRKFINNKSTEPKTADVFAQELDFYMNEIDHRFECNAGILL